MGKKIYLISIIIISSVSWLFLSGEGMNIVSAISLDEPTLKYENELNNAAATTEFTCGSSEENNDKCQTMAQSILSSTLRIEINTWIVYVEGEGYKSFFSNGHGTVMNGRYLLTHNHFSQPIVELFADDFNGAFATITLFTADGNFLWAGPLTTASIAFDDSETLLLDFSSENNEGLFDSLAIPSADFDAQDNQHLSVGATLAQVNWNYEQAFVQWTKVEDVTNDRDTPVVDLEACIVGGSSGGGVFLNGVHVANNWSRSIGCSREETDAALLYSTAALNSAELLAAGNSDNS